MKVYKCPECCEEMKSANLANIFSCRGCGLALEDAAIKIIERITMERDNAISDAMKMAISSNVMMNMLDKENYQDAVEIMAKYRGKK